MEISLQNNFGVQIKGKAETVLINPKMPVKPEAARVLIFSDNRYSIYEHPVAEGQVVISGPGSYEVGGVEVIGLNSGENGEATIYLITVDNVVVGYVPKLEFELSDKKVARLEEIDVLVGVCEGVYGGKKFLELAKHTGATQVIPQCESEEHKKEFLDAADVESSEEKNSIKITPDTLPDSLEVVLLATNGSKS